MNKALNFQLLVAYLFISDISEVREMYSKCIMLYVRLGKLKLIKEAQQTCAFTFQVMKIQDNVHAIFTMRIYRLKISNQSSQINIYLKMNV